MQMIYKYEYTLQDSCNKKVNAYHNCYTKLLVFEEYKIRLILIPNL